MGKPAREAGLCERCGRFLRLKFNGQFGMHRDGGLVFCNGQEPMRGSVVSITPEVEKEFQRNHNIRRATLIKQRSTQKLTATP